MLLKTDVQLIKQGNVRDLIGTGLISLSIKFYSEDFSSNAYTSKRLQVSTSASFHVNVDGYLKLLYLNAKKYNSPIQLWYEYH